MAPGPAAVAAEECNGRVPLSSDVAGDANFDRSSGHRFWWRAASNGDARNCTIRGGRCRLLASGAACASLLVLGAVAALRSPLGLRILDWSQLFARAPGNISARAEAFAKLAGASYCSEDHIKNWSCGMKCIPGVSNASVCEGSTTKAFVAMWEEQCIVSFMGTQAYMAMLRDAQFYKTPVPLSTSGGCKDCYVHAGFLYEWQSLRKCIIGQLQHVGCPSSRVRMTGHSMGGGVASIAAMDLADQGWDITEAFTFGQPRTGEENFARTFNDRFGNRFWRVTHHMDPVIHIPPQNFPMSWYYWHVEPELFYDGAVSDGYKVCHKDGDETCAGQYATIYAMFHLGDHMQYMDIPIGTPGCGLQDAMLNVSLVIPELNTSLRGR
mmetsp:Transcript_44805/g.140423  ORF Transcript_44805/g.140423 Transcript_44805/m.140423 type:complete len:381 (-) Transcript_44805:54-1196(-)